MPSAPGTKRSLPQWGRAAPPSTHPAPLAKGKAATSREQRQQASASLHPWPGAQLHRPAYPRPLSKTRPRIQPMPAHFAGDRAAAPLQRRSSAQEPFAKGLTRDPAAPPLRVSRQGQRHAAGPTRSGIARAALPSAAKRPCAKREWHQNPAKGTRNGQRVPVQAARPWNLPAASARLRMAEPGVPHSLG